MFQKITDYSQFKVLLTVFDSVFPPKLRIPHPELEYRWRKKYYTIFADKELACFAFVVPFQEMIHIDYLGVAQSHQGKGLARKMLEFLISFGKPLSLECEDRLIPFYGKFGFIPTKFMNVGLRYLVRDLTIPDCRKMLYYLNTAFSLEPFSIFFLPLFIAYHEHITWMLLMLLYRYHHMDGFVG